MECPRGAKHVDNAIQVALEWLLELAKKSLHTLQRTAKSLLANAGNYCDYCDYCDRRTAATRPKYQLIAGWGSWAGLS